MSSPGLPAIRLLGPGDEALVVDLALDDAAFGHEPDVDDALEPLTADQAAGFLRDPAVRYWVAVEASEDGAGQVVGQLYCVVHPIRSQPGREVLLFEIATRHDRRRQGIGRALLAALDGWMAGEGIVTAWVLADDADAAAFYAACGWTVQPDQPTYLERSPTS